MTSTDDHFLRFTCPRCLNWLKAPAAQASTRRRCPRCQLVFEVPRQTRQRTSGEEYPLRTGDGPSVAEQATHIPVICPRCHSRMYGTVEEVGKELVCPECGTRTVVPPPAAASPARRKAAPTIVEDYALCEDGAGQGRNREAEQLLIRVICPVCSTMLYATEDQVGKELVCPDCRAPTIVRRPPELPARLKPPSAEEIGEYALAKTVGRPAREPRVPEQSYVAMQCPICHTRLHAPLAQVGAKLKCPDCGTSATVPPPPPPRKKIDPMAGAGEGYRLAAWDDPRPAATAPQIEPNPARLAGGDRRAPIETRPSLKPDPPRPVLPPRPFVTGTFNFPLSRGAATYSLILAAWAAFWLGLAWYSITLASTPNEVTWFGSAMFGGIAGVFGLMWFAFAAACALVVLRDTAHGCDEVVEWPGILFLDWMADPLYLFDSLCVSVLPGAALGWLLAKSGVPGGLLLGPLSGFLLFPIVLLSMLEVGSPFAPVSRLICKSLATAAGGWGAFYLTAAVLLALGCTAMMIAFAVGGPLATVAEAIILTAFWLIYFRLLGRLAWYCDERHRHARREDGEDDDVNDDDEHDLQIAD